MNGRVYDPTLGRFLTADPYVQAPFWSQGLNRYAYVFNSPLNYTDPSGFSAIDDYFQGLNDAPPEQAIPGYIGTALVAGLAAYTVYEAVSATISTSASNAAATSVAESGGGDAPGAGAPGAAYVAMQRFGRAMGPTTRTVPGKPPTHALTTRTGGGQQSATVQNRALRPMGNELGQVVIPVPNARRFPPGAPPVVGNPYEDLAKALVKQWERSQLRQDVRTVGDAVSGAWDWIVRTVRDTDASKPPFTGEPGSTWRGATQSRRYGRMATPKWTATGPTPTKAALGKVTIPTTGDGLLAEARPPLAIGASHVFRHPAIRPRRVGLEFHPRGLMMPHITCDENGFVRGFPYHDGALDGVLLDRDQVVHFAVRAVSGERRVITLRRVKRLFVEGFREGNILLNLRLLPLARVVDVPELSRGLVGRLQVELRNLGTEWLLFWLEASYGAEAIAVCGEAEVGETGSHLAVRA